MRLVAALFCILLTGCHLQPKVLYRAAYPPTAQQVEADRRECGSLDAKQFGWTIAATALGILSGGSGGVTALVPDEAPKYAVASVSLGLGLLTGVSTVLASMYAKKYSDRCTNNTGGNQ